MTVTVALPELQCNNDQLVCPLQNITCQCVAMGTGQAIIWKLHSEVIASFETNGKPIVTNANYPATVEVLEGGQSSNVSFPAVLQPGPMTVECIDGDFKSETWSYSIVGLFLRVYTFIEQIVYHIICISYL